MEMTPEQEYRVKQVAATMALSDMPLTREAHQNLVDVATGAKTSEEVIAEIKAKYGEAEGDAM